MKVLLVSRGSQGDVYPYLRLARELENRGHMVTLNIPFAFEQHAKDSGVHNYCIQGKDDITGLMESELDTKDLLRWTTRVIDQQFKELIPLLHEHDILIASNTEFAAPTIAEHCNKPYIRTAYGPFVPSETIPPPVFPWPNPHPIFTPTFLWRLLNSGLNMMVKKPLNKTRAALNMPLITDQAEHAPANAFNFFMYSPSLGSVDPDWKCRWDIGGYIFNDDFTFNEEKRQNFLKFVKKDDKPTLFFTLGSCNSDVRDRFTSYLDAVCQKLNVKLAIGCGWHEVGAKLPARENLLLLDGAVPHCHIFPHVTAIVHHGGVGTTHSAARAGRPQMIVPLFLDQWYWGNQTKNLNLGPGYINIKKMSEKALFEKIKDLLENPSYKTGAAALAEKIHAENGLEAACAIVENPAIINFKRKARQN
jgi:UDP:flavonoid glycosyltransferase YjiC (YdhE family)